VRTNLARLGFLVLPTPIPKYRMPGVAKQPDADGATDAADLANSTA
jgi:hypothetical protein